MAERDEVGGESVRVSELFENPDYLLHGINFARGTCEFLEVSRATYERSAFLDQRVMASGGRRCTVDLGELVHLSNSIRPPARAPAFIAHTSFCCSTLLARSLEFHGRSLVLREPQVLLMLARAYREHPDYFPGPARHIYLSLILRLLNKSYGQRERVLIKPSNLANRLLEEWLAHDGDSRGIVLTCGLEDYLVSVLRKPTETKEKMPWVAADLARDSDYLERCPDVVSGLGDPLQAAAVAWHAQRYLLGALIARFPGRLFPLDQKFLLEQPSKAVARVCRHLQVDVGQQAIENRIHGAVWRSHAKDTRHAYNPDRRRRDHQEVRKTYEHEIERVVGWLSPYLCRLPDPLADAPASAHSNHPMTPVGVQRGHAASGGTS